MPHISVTHGHIMISQMCTIFTLKFLIVAVPYDVQHGKKTVTVQMSMHP